MSRAPRLLFLDQYGEMGGGQRVLLSLLRAALATGATVSVLAPGGGTLQAFIAEAFGDRVTFVSCEEIKLSHGRKGLSDVLALLAYAWRFRRHLSLMRAQDVIYVNGLRHLLHSQVMATCLQARFIYHIHLQHSSAERWLLRLAARARSTFALVSNSRFVRDRLGFSSSRLRLIENALDSSFAHQPFVNRFNGSLPWTAAVFGTIRPEKGQDIAIAALSDRSDMALRIIGRDGDGAGPWLANLRANAPAHVHFDGPVTDTAAAFSDHRVQFNLVPSRWEEPFGLVAIEGMASSCLTIVSGRGGLAEIAERTGALVADGTESLRHLLARLTTTPLSELADIARKQHERAITHYNPARFEAQIAALLREALDACGARAKDAN